MITPIKVYLMVCLLAVFTATSFAQTTLTPAANANHNTETNAVAAPNADNTSVLQQENQRLAQALAQLRKTASKAVVIDNRNQVLETRMVEMERELQLLRQENNALHDRNNQAWFLRGAGVLLAGLLCGVFLSKLQRPKQATRWSEL